MARSATTVSCSTAATAALASPRFQTGPEAEVTEDGLHRIDGRTFDHAWARPGVDLSIYDRILLRPPEIALRDVKDPGLRRGVHEYPLDDKQRETLRTTIHQAFAKELGRSKRFTLVDQSGPGVLEIRGALVDVVSHIPEDPIGRGTVFVRVLGEATLVVELRDSLTHEALARAIDRRTAESATWSRSNPIANLSDVRIAAQRLAGQLRRRLEDFAAL